MLCGKKKGVRRRARIGFLPRKRKAVSRGKKKKANVKINYTNLSVNSLNSEPIKTCLKESLG